MISLNRGSFAAIVFAVLVGGLVKADEAAIKSIRATYNAIESAKLDSSTILFENEDDPTSGKLTRYSKAGEIVKIAVEWGGEHGAASESFYYSNGALIFVFKTESYWSFTGRKLSNGQSETVDQLTEYRLYFSQGKQIRALKRSVKSSDAKQLSAKIAKVANANFNDPELVKHSRERGAQFYQFFSAQSVKDVFGE